MAAPVTPRTTTRLAVDTAAFMADTWRWVARESPTPNALADRLTQGVTRGLLVNGRTITVLRAWGDAWPT